MLIVNQTSWRKSCCMFFHHEHHVSLKGIAAWYLVVPYYVITTVLKRRTSKDIHLEKQSWILRWLMRQSDPVSSEMTDPSSDCVRSLRKIFLASVQFSTPSVYLEETEKTHTYLEICPQSMYLPISKEYVVDLDADPSLCVAPAYSLVWCQVVVNVVVEINTHLLWTVVINICLEIASALCIFLPKWKTNQTSWLKQVFLRKCKRTFITRAGDNPCQICFIVSL